MVSELTRALEQAEAEAWGDLEASEPRPDNVAQSCRNVTRLGFEAALARQNFLWTGS